MLTCKQHPLPVQIVLLGIEHDPCYQSVPPSWKKTSAVQSYADGAGGKALAKDKGVDKRSVQQDLLV